jgi:hypothetical protein
VSLVAQSDLSSKLIYYVLEPHLEDEVAIQPGDIMLVHKVFDDGWAAGENSKTGQTGIFPLPCCVQANEANDIDLRTVHSRNTIGKRDSSYTYRT